MTIANLIIPNGVLDIIIGFTMICIGIYLLYYSYVRYCKLLESDTKKEVKKKENN